MTKDSCDFHPSLAAAATVTQRRAPAFLTRLVLNALDSHTLSVVHRLMTAFFCSYRGLYRFLSIRPIPRAADTLRFPPVRLSVRACPTEAFSDRLAVDF